MNTHADKKADKGPEQSFAAAQSDKRSIYDNSAVGASPAAAMQRKQNHTGMPDSLKAGVEKLSGLSMDDVQVHYHSAAPAQLQAHAFAQGNQVHIAPGQEKHLPHEAWHVVQQKQGRVQATRQLKGADINDDSGLEAEADTMGEKARSFGSMLQSGSTQALVQRKASGILQFSLEKTTPDGKWIFSEYAIQRGAWTGLREHTLTYEPTGGPGTKKIALIQVVQTRVGGQDVTPPGLRKRTNPNGFRVDTLPESNNPVFGAPKSKHKDLDDTPFSDDVYNLGQEKDPGRSKRRKTEIKHATRLDNPGIGRTFLQDNNLENESMSQLFITTAFDMNTGDYLGSITYGWERAQNGDPQLKDLSFTTGGASDNFLEGVAQWNTVKGNIPLPEPPSVASQNFP